MAQKVPMTKNFIENENTELAKSWDYLGSIHVVYMMLQNSISDYTKAKNKNVVIDPYVAELRSKLHSATLMAYSAFGRYLQSLDDNNYKFQDYLNVWKDNIKPEDLLDMAYELIHWYQTYGYFRLENVKDDPHLALQNG